jgi:hypothetical protein
MATRARMSSQVLPTNLAWEISHAFITGALDLCLRRKAPPVGWESLPETVMALELRSRGESDVFVRLSTTFLAAMDRARDAEELWRRGLRLHKETRWAYDIDEVVRRSLSELADVLMAAGVSQRHLGDSAAWRRIAESLQSSRRDAPVRQVIERGHGSTVRLLEDLASGTAGGSARFPYLSGPKVGPMWVRMMVQPGGAKITGMDIIPVAVDVQVRRVTEMLYVTDTEGRQLEDVRAIIQDAWRARARADGVDAPGALANTTAGLDPALWFFAKWGCSHCEPLRRRVPIGNVCAACRLPVGPPSAAKQSTPTAPPEKPLTTRLREMDTPAAGDRKESMLAQPSGRPRPPKGPVRRGP